MSTRCSRAKELGVDNCHEEYEGEKEYCLFHKPEKIGSEANRFYRELIEKDNPQEENGRFIFETMADFTGYIFPRGEDENSEFFKDSEFKSYAIFEDAIFNCDIVFNEATFKSLVTFKEATFEKKVKMRGVNFEEQERKTSFEQADFLESVDFSKASFDGSTNFIAATFEKMVEFTETVFKDSVDFRSSEFKHLTYFKNSIFEDSAIFSQVKFEGGYKTSFEEARFNGIVKFDGGVKFGGVTDFKITYFDKIANFNEAKFQQKVTFKDAKFSGSAIFYMATFEDAAIFYNVNFNETAHFWRTHFKGKSSFDYVNLKKTVNFRKACFSGEVSFKNTLFLCEGGKIGENFRHKDIPWPDFLLEAIKSKSDNKSEEGTFNYKNIAEFSHTTFEGETNFENANFKNQARFEDSSFDDVAIFDKIEFEKMANFLGTKFERSVTFSQSIFRDEVVFHYCGFSQGVVIEPFYRKVMIKQEGKQRIHISEYEEYIIEGEDELRELVKEACEPEERFGTNQALKEAYRVQRITYENEGEKERADEMFVEEMRTRREIKKESGTFFEKLWAYFEKPIADWTCKYGTSWKRVLGMSGLLILFFGGIYWLLNRFTEATIRYINGRTISTSIMGLLDSFYYSIVTFTTLGYGDMHPTGILKLLSAIQSIIGAVFMALLVAVFARKWMR